MAKLLYVESSPRKQRSASIEVAKAFLDAYRIAHPGDSIQTIDVWNLKLPEFDGAAKKAVPEIGELHVLDSISSKAIRNRTR